MHGYIAAEEGDIRFTPFTEYQTFLMKGSLQSIAACRLKPPESNLRIIAPSSHKSSRPYSSNYQTPSYLMPDPVIHSLTITTTTYKIPFTPAITRPQPQPAQYIPYTIPNHPRNYRFAVHLLRTRGMNYRWMEEDTITLNSSIYLQTPTLCIMLAS